MMIHDLQLGKESAGFQPHPLLAERFRHWQGVDLMGKEQAIIKQVVERAALHWFAAEGSEWWLELANSVANSDPSQGWLVPTKSARPGIAMVSDVQGESNPS